ncbi:hypothetical protein Pmar_PMAR019968 [Perkinsus marinus ATCC 50983]|uniref:Uncharacterized protein n=1 Tax=Perkinsus marinus (strain ATCC 50983 / TXsc) TaxID=423536 RepID=C5LJ75_PERM5|nr:hypothetical protein Pmar_PMAR019968 [Perkinsus marinus ATCC 50983]EER03191.1 hypothetical protein Pmar_PMAR019968 [Perkinsus marinus ATCC 50983]|eukprot:XP_002771375.1 hypothetical protein Pmar_PMAR019968 [Perkinsus marinus ATCC 50983]
MIRQASSFAHNEKFPEMDELGLNPPVDPPPASPEIDALFELYRAVARGDDDIVRSMVSEGRPLSKLNSLKASPVLLSVWNNDPRMLSMLLESGADGSSIDRKDNVATLLALALKTVRTGNCRLVKCTAADPGGVTPVEAADDRDDMIEALIGRSSLQRR